jgi:hypothetical protein
MPAHQTFPKPSRGAYLLERKAKRKARVVAEQKQMQAAKRRDGGKCRYPGCWFKDMPVDAAHFQHRGIGGNPSGDRTTRATVISLCRIHHGQYDGALLEIEPLTDQMFDGPCVYYKRNQETGTWASIGQDRTVAP